jgi:hypothetical protein
MVRASNVYLCKTGHFQEKKGQKITLETILLLTEGNLEQKESIVKNSFHFFQKTLEIETKVITELVDELVFIDRFWLQHTSGFIKINLPIAVIGFKPLTLPLKHRTLFSIITHRFPRLHRVLKLTFRPIFQ